MSKAELKKGAILSLCGTYRYYLYRCWDAKLPRACFVMLNPSTADKDTDDATVRKCVAFARRWNCGGIIVVNLFAYRATDPKELAGAYDPIGHRNLAYIRDAVRGCNPVVAAWGAGVPKRHAAQAKQVEAVLRSVVTRLVCLKTTKAGHPGHPLYVKLATELKPFLPEGTKC